MTARTSFSISFGVIAAPETIFTGFRCPVAYTFTWVPPISRTSTLIPPLYLNDGCFPDRRHIRTVPPFLCCSIGQRYERPGDWGGSRRCEFRQANDRRGRDPYRRRD